MQKIINKQKAPKDIILNSILKEIGEENGVVVEPKVVEVQKTKKKKKKKKKSTWVKTVFNFLILMVILLFSFLVYIVITKEKKDTTIHAKVVKSIQVPKSIPKPIVTKKITQKNIIKKVSKTVQKPIHKKKQITLDERKALEHKKAKEILLQQMKN